MNEAIFEVVKKIHLQKEEILTAFIAKYGCSPEECEQVVQHNSDGTVTWSVRKKEPA